MIRVITAPAAYPVTRAEARLWCKAFSDVTADDVTFDGLISAMTDYAEHLTGRAFVERTLELSLPCFEHCIKLPWAPLIGIDSIKYTDTALAEQIVDPATYEVDTVNEPGRVQPIWASYWPSVGYGFNPVRIRYRAGYRPVGSPIDLTDNSYLPAQLRIFIEARIATLYENREQFVVGNQQVAELPRDFACGMLDKLVLGTRLF
jgi:uncharacterized phiE125 gp8 family phage protein